MSPTQSIDPIQERTESCQGLVRSIALSIFERLHRQYELDELIASGLLGLTQAARDFDPSRGNQFSTYAYHRIRGEIYDNVGRMGLKHWKNVQEDALWNDVAADSSESPEAADVADEARWFQGTVERMATSHVLVDGGGDVPDQKVDAPWKRMYQAEIIQKLNEILKRLPDDARQLIQMTYFEGMTLQDAGQRLGISRSWASRLHGKALEILTRHLKTAGLDE